MNVVRTSLKGVKSKDPENAYRVDAAKLFARYRNTPTQKAEPACAGSAFALTTLSIRS
jgi:hypothetical protein